MTSAPLDDRDQKDPVSRFRLQELEACALRAELDARNIQLLQEQVTKLESTLKHEQARSEKLAAAFAEVARMCDNRARDFEAQHAAKLAKLEFAHDAAIAGMEKRFIELEASHARTIAAKDAAYAKLEREKDADAAAQLTAIHAAVTSKLALEIQPVRTDGLQFATLHVGPVPFETFAFDSAWRAAACGNKWRVDVDPVTCMRAHVTQGPGHDCLTLRSAAPLPRRVLSSGASPQQLPSYRVVIEAYPTPVDGKRLYCNVGFVPSHKYADGAAVTPVVGHHFCHYGGWWFAVSPTESLEFTAGVTLHGWDPLPPRAAAADGEAASDNTGAYATTLKVPPVPAGSAVEFVVDYAASTCRVAFYTPAAAAGGFVEAPHAKMELRFVATDAGDVPGSGAVPARSVPTVASGSRVQFFPAVAVSHPGAVFRFL
jgi:hypothetical protein